MAEVLFFRQCPNAGRVPPPLAKRVAGRDKGWGCWGHSEALKKNCAPSEHVDQTFVLASTPPTLPSPPLAARAGGGTRPTIVQAKAR